MAALGDSLTTGFGSCVLVTSCRRNSWSTGDGLRVRSHLRRIAQTQPAIRRHAHNYAAGGARAADLPRQAESAARRKVAYVTILVGANDACRPAGSPMTDPGDFRDDVDRALAILRRASAKTRVLVVSVPDLYRLWRIGHTDPRAVRAWARGVCPSLLARPTSQAAADEARRKSVRDRVTAYNRELAAACRAYGPRCRYDGGAVHRIRFTLAMVSALDYFHPNTAGQNRLAAATYPGRFTW